MLLTDEEIKETAKVPPEDYGAPPHWWLRANQRVAKAQLTKFMEWLGERVDYNGVTFKRFRISQKDWESLLKEIGRM